MNTDAPNTVSDTSADNWSRIGVLSSGIRIGSTGDAVKQLQTLLGVTADGIYGPATDKALKQGFVTTTMTAAQDISETTRIPAAIATAQAIVESAYGREIPVDMDTGIYSYNIFGIKAIPPEDCVTCMTHEDSGGKSNLVKAQFAAYSSFHASLAGHAAFLESNARYADLFTTMDPVAWADGLQSTGYATDPDYATKLTTLMKQWHLT